MTLPLMLFFIAVVIPVFFSKIRSAPTWLALQALALGWNGVAQHDELSMHTLMALAEVLIMRAALVPLLLRRAIHQRAEPNLDLMPSNLFSWVVATALVVLAFEFAAPSMMDRHAFTLGAVGATVVVALMLLSTNSSPLAQLVALLFLENALALFESLFPEPWPLPVHAALSGIYLLTVGVGSWLIGTRESAAIIVKTEELHESR
jgi:hydrogenase-4 membrane subunit HyfE